MSPTAPDVGSKICASHSNNTVTTAAQNIAKLDAAFSQRMAGKIRFAPTGLLTIRTFHALSTQADEIMTLIARLEQRLARLEQALAQQK